MRLKWGLGGLFAAALVFPFIVIAVGRASGALPSQAEWIAQGGNHGPWHPSQVLCPHELVHDFAGAPFPSEHRWCERKEMLLTVLERVFYLVWCSLPLAGTVGLATFTRTAINRRAWRAALPGVGIFVLGTAGWCLQGLFVAWVFD